MNYFLWLNNDGYPSIINLYYSFIPLKSTRWPIVVEDIGVEPMTPCVQGKCSSQLS